MLAGFKSELGARKDAINKAKVALEGCYAQTLGKSDEVIQADKDLLQTITSQLVNVETAFTSFNGTIKSIKMAIDTWLKMFFFFNPAAKPLHHWVFG